MLTMDGNIMFFSLLFSTQSRKWKVRKLRTFLQIEPCHQCQHPLT